MTEISPELRQILSQAATDGESLLRHPASPAVVSFSRRGCLRKDSPELRDIFLLRRLSFSTHNKSES